MLRKKEKKKNYNNYSEYPKISFNFSHHRAPGAVTQSDTAHESREAQMKLL